MKELRTQNENMVNHLQESTDEIVFLKNQINDLEQYGRRDMVEIHGIERKENEDTNNLVLKIAKKVNADISNDDIDISHRISKKDNASIIVKFINRKKRSNFFLKTRQQILKNKDITDTDSESRVFINDSLTFQNKRKLKYTKEKLKDIFKFIWFRNEKLFVRNPNSSVIEIKSKKQVDDLLLKYSTLASSLSESSFN